MLIFKDNEQALNLIFNEVDHIVRQRGAAIYGNDVNHRFANLIAAAVEAAFRKAIEIQYTDQDFESDIGLNK